MSALVLNSALFFLGVLDLLLALWVFGFPRGFHRFFFGMDPTGSWGILYRSGGLWLTFSFLQFAALVTWQAYPAVLLLIVGVRLSEWCADWVFLLAESRFTRLGKVGFFISPPFTVSFALLFTWGYYALTPTQGELVQVIPYLPSSLTIDCLLALLVLLDFLLGREALVAPERLSDWLGESPDSDRAGLMSRTGGIWLGFGVVQLAVLLSWRLWPGGLLVVAGMRLTETLADWILLVAHSRRYGVSRFVLALIPPVNAALAGVFYQGFVATQLLKFI